MKCQTYVYVELLFNIRIGEFNTYTNMMNDPGLEQRNKNCKESGPYERRRHHRRT